MNIPCGCSITTYKDSWSDEQGPARIVYCPLHAAAPKLLGAVKAMQAACGEWVADFTQGKRAMDWGVINEANLKASRSIAKAESKPAERETGVA